MFLAVLKEIGEDRRVIGAKAGSTVTVKGEQKQDENRLSKIGIKI